MDLTETITPRSDQLNSDDLMTGPVTVTISRVTKGNPEQPVNVELIEYPGRPYKPSKSMRRVMVAAWGADASLYNGRRLTLYRNPDIMFGRDKVGGIEISHLSDITNPLTLALTATRGKKKPFTVQPLPDEPVRNWDELIAGCTTVEELKALHQQATDPKIQARIRAAAEAVS
jgi:hypothetical protein